MNFLGIFSVVASAIGVLWFFGWSWNVVKYRTLRLFEYPHVTSETSPSAAIIFVGMCVVSGGVGVLFSFLCIAFAVVMMLHPEVWIHTFGEIEGVVGGLLLFVVALGWLHALQQAYRQAFPVSILDEQLALRGHQMPDELKARRKMG